MKPPVKTYTLSQLATLYQISPKTMRRLLKEKKLYPEQESKRKVYYTPDEVRKIFQSLGVPDVSEAVLRFVL